MRYVRGGAVLPVLAALVVSGVAYETAWADQHTVTYSVATHDPVCVAIYVEAMEAVTRLTTLREHYDTATTLAGVPILVQVPENRASSAVQSLLERPLVHSVQRVGTFWNGSHTIEWPLQINPNADASNRPSHCYHIDSNLAWHLRNAIIQSDIGASGDSGEPREEMAHVRLNPTNLTSMRAYLEENGATIQLAVASREYQARTLGPQMIALIPHSIIPSLVERDDFGSMDTIHAPELLGHGGTSGGFGITHTGGLRLHEHAAGYTGVGIRVGVIYTEFDGIEDALNSGELPRNMILHCNGPTTTLARCQTGTANSNRTHGISVAEIVMDMVPDARLVIGLRTQDYTVYNITEWMVEQQDVNVIVASISPLVFEGPGDGTNPDIGIFLDAIDLAVANDVTWVNVAGNYNDRNTWYRINPPTIQHGLEWRVPFAAGQTENAVTVYPNLPLKVVLRWDGPWSDPDDRPIDLNLHLECPTGLFGLLWQDVATSTRDQNTVNDPRPLEDLTYSRATQMECRLVIKSPGGDVTGQLGWVQVMSNYGMLTFNTAHTMPDMYSLTNNATAATTEPDDVQDVNNATDTAMAMGPDVNNTVVLLNITTHNPACTAAFLNHTDITRLTDVWPQYRDGVPKYGPDEYERGINITAIIWSHQTNETVAVVVEQMEVSRVAAYLHAAQNATSPEQPRLLALAIDPDVEKFTGPSPCHPLSYNIAEALLDEIGWAGAGPNARPTGPPNADPTGASSQDREQDSGPVTLAIDRIPFSDLELGRWGTTHYGDLFGLGIATNNTTATWTYLKENGALVTRVVDENDQPDRYGRILAYIPPSLVWGIIERDEVLEIQEYILRRLDIGQ